MEILHVINDLEIGGAQKLLHDLMLLQHSDPSTHPKCFVLRRCDSDLERNLQEKGVEIISADTPGFSFSTLKKLCHHMKESDVIHAHLFPSNYMAAFGNLFAAKPLIFTEHSTHNKRREHKILKLPERIMYGRYACLVCISNATADNLTKWIGSKIADSRIRIIPNGIDITRFESVKSKQPNEIFGRPGDPLLMISRFTDSKDQATVIRALTQIEDSNVFAVFVGDGERREEMERLAEHYGVAERVVFMGTCNHIPEIINSAKIGIQSSNWEGFGLTAIEIMAGGIPVIASDVAGLNDVVKDGGILFPPGDAEALAREIKNLFSDKELYEKLQRLGKERAQKYSIKATAENYKTLYKEIVGQRPTS